ncbi:g4884 [Coccomyxa viridis]|uniref:GDT1 family protein n=1 Tax=Coccomyxa viridis TaxID=1274662 RepID=A0ABP1FVE0_9CHLO
MSILQPLGCRHSQPRTCALLSSHGSNRPLRGALGASSGPSFSRQHKQNCCSRHSPSLQVRAQAEAGGAAEASPPPDDRSLFRGLSWGAAVLILAAAGWAIIQNLGYTPLIKDWAAHSAIGKSGFLAAFSLIFLSEIGDKTFFLAGLLALKVGKLISFLGSTAALGLMTVISVLIGYCFKSVPDALKSSVPIGQYLSVACMLYFGVRTIKEASEMSPDEEAESGEMESAQESLAEAEKSGSLGSRAALQSLLQVGSIIFLAEWGDRSMLATVALGASHSPLGVSLGAVLGHALATLLAVTGGALASKYISERALGFAGGSLFLVFAALTLFGVF